MDQYTMIFIDLIHCRCLAHIINLVMQALIATCSKAKYYNPHVLDEHEPDTNGTDFDEIGLICTIIVKVGLFLFFMMNLALRILMTQRNTHHLNIKSYSKLFNDKVAPPYLSSSYLT